MCGVKRVCLIPITENNYPKGAEIPGQARDSNIIEVVFLRFATHLAIPGLTRDLVCFQK